MSPHPPPVPSRNALRALRRLAFGGSTVIGAVGSVLAAATVNHDTQRRVRLAEKLVERKQTIRSISNSNGAAHVARMFEAAERGEDFGMRVTRMQNQHDRKRYSAVAETKTEQIPPEDWLSLGGRPVRNDKVTGKALAHHAITYRRGSPVGYGERTMVCPDLGSMASFERSPDGRRPRQADNPVDKNRSTEKAPLRHRISYRRGSPVGYGERTMMCPDLGLMASFETTTSWKPQPSVPPEIAEEHSEEHITSDGAESKQLKAGAKLLGPSTAKMGKREARNKKASVAQQWPVADDKQAAQFLESDLTTDVAAEKNDILQESSSAAERMMAATLQQHKLHSHTVYGRPRQNKIGAPSALNEHVDLWLKDDAKQQREHSGANQHHRNNQRHHAPLTKAPRPVGDPARLNEQGNSSSPDDSLRLLSPKLNELESDYPDTSTHQRVDMHSAIDTPIRYVALGRISSVERDGNDFQVNKPVAVSNRKRSLYWRSIKKPTNQSVVNDLSNMSLSSSQITSTFTGLLGTKPAPDTAQLNMGEAFEYCVMRSQEKGYAVWNDFITHVTATEGIPTGRKFWLKAMTYYSGSSGVIDWDMVDLLHKNFFSKFSSLTNPQPVHLLTRYILQRPFTSDARVERAAELLFPFHRHRTVKEARLATEQMNYGADWQSRDIFANALAYLDETWNQTMDSGKTVKELRKVMRAAKSLNIKLAENLFAGILLRLSANGQVHQAQVLFDEMKFYHRIKPSFYTRSVLIWGYARISDWERLAREMEIMHNEDLSRQEPVGYASMFDNVLQEYASKRPIAQVHDFLVNALGYWGLVPTSVISATAIQAYLTHGRFDLVREWVETVRILFPQVDIDTAPFAWKIGSFWEESDASCEEVEEACKAMSYRNDLRRLSDEFKRMARQALARDLATKLCAVRAAGNDSEENHELNIGAPLPLDHYLENAHSVIPRLADISLDQSTEPEESRKLRSQLQSAIRLNELFHSRKAAAPSLAKTKGQAPSKPLKDNRASFELTQLQSDLPEELMRQFLPSTNDTQDLLDKYYATQKAESIPTNHAVVKYVCRKLTKQHRLFDALKLLHTTFTRPYVQSNPISGGSINFDLPLFEMWLKLAHDMKSVRSCQTVLWAVFDSGSTSLKLTEKFLLLAEMTVRRVSNYRFSSLKTRHPHVVEELKWLLAMLNCRLWVQEGRVVGGKGDPRRDVVLGTKAWEVLAYG